MWIVEWQSLAAPYPWIRYSHVFETEEEANTFMVMQIFDEPWYNYRVRKLGE